MKSMSGVGIWFSVVFGCLFVALIVELYYVLWWKKKKKKRRVNNEDERDYDDSKCKSSQFPLEDEIESSPRFLFTIEEETNEDLESSEDDDVIVNVSDHSVGTQYYTPSHDNVELSSPPPVFKFLRDAEEKLLQRRRELMEQVYPLSGSLGTLNKYPSS